MRRDTGDQHQGAAETALLASIGNARAKEAEAHWTTYAAGMMAALKDHPGQVASVLQFTEDVFRREQLAITQRIEKALAGEDTSATLALLDERRERQYRPLHDLMIDLKAGAYDWIVTAYGPAALFACHRHIAESQRAGFTKWETMPVEDHVRQAARIFALHLGKTRVVREDDRYRFVLEPCGTGGRMAATGSLARPGEFHATIPGVHGFTFGRQDLPAYCAHCAVWNEIAATEWFGHPQWVFAPWQRPGEPCGFSVYTELNAIPADVYRRMSKSKPSRLPQPPRATSPLSDEDLATIGRLPSEALRDAVMQSDWPGARALVPELGKEFILMIKGLRLVLEPLSAWIVAFFDRKQAETGLALKANDATNAKALVAQVLAQHGSLQALFARFFRQCARYHQDAYGEAGLAALHAHREAPGA